MVDANSSLHPSRDADPLLRTIGHTPLVPLPRIGADFPGVRLLAKAEWRNVSGSVKIRPAYRMIRSAEVAGVLTADKTILDATSGNTGIAYALIAARRGYRVKLLLPANASAERKTMLSAYGAELVLTDPGEGSDGAFFAAQQLFQREPDRYFYPDQYGNPENARAHYETTALEIIGQTGGALTHFVAGLGTSGTMMGIGRRLREFNPQIKLVAVQPDASFHGLEGLKHLATSPHVPALYDPKFPDEFVGVKTEDAVAMAKRMTREEGLFVGISAGAAIWATLQVATRIQQGILVAICPDGGDRYHWD